MTISDAPARAGDAGAASRSGTSGEAADQATSRYASLDEMKAAHRHLLELARDKQLERAPVLEFLRLGRGVGALLDALDDRVAAQGMLNYWTARLYSAPLRGPDAAASPQETVLAEFDSATVRDVADRSEAAVASLTSRDRDTARRVLLRMLRLTSDPGRFEAETIDRTALDGLDNAQRLSRVLQVLAQAGALRIGRGAGDRERVALQYESLMRQWKRLRSWLEERVSFRDAAYGGGLIWGKRLDEAARYHDLDGRELDFIDANSKRRRWLVGLLVFLLVVTFAALVFGFLADRRADSSRHLAQVANDPDPEYDGGGLDAAVKAAGIDKTEEAERALHKTLRDPMRIWDFPLSRKSEGFSVDPNGSRLAIVLADGAVGLIDAVSGRLLQTLPPPPSRVIFEVALHGDHLATAMLGGEKKEVELWTAAPGRQSSWSARKLADLEDLSTMAFSADGRYLAVAGSSPDLDMWSVEPGRAGRVLHTLYKGAIQSFSFSADGRTIATSGDRGEVSLWDARTLDKLRDLPLEALRDMPAEELRNLPMDNVSTIGPVTSLAFSKTGLLATTTGGGATTWNVDRGQPLKRFTRKASGCQEPAILTVAFSRDGQYLVTAGEGGGARIWLAASGLEVASVPTGLSTVQRAVFIPDGDLILATVGPTGSRRASRWSFAVAPRVALGEQARAPYLQFAFLGNKALLVGAGTEAWKVQWDRNAFHPWSQEVTSWCPHFPHGAWMSFSGDGSRIACGGMVSEQGLLEVWTTNSVHPAMIFQQRAASMGIVQISSDGTRVAALRKDRRGGDIWDLDGKRHLAVMPDLGDAVKAVTFARGGASIAVATDGGMAETWVVATPTRRFELGDQGKDGVKVLAVAFNPTKPQIATVGDDGLIKLWDAGDGHRIQPETKMHHEDVHALAFNANGSLLATASALGVAKLWDAADGRTLLTFRGYGGPCRGIAFSQDRTLLAMAAEDGTVQVEILDVDWLRQIASTRLHELRVKKTQARPPS